MTTRQKLEELIYVGFKETDSRIKALAEESKTTDAQIKKLSQEVGKITNTLGRFVEDMVAPAVVRLFNKAGIPIVQCSQRVISPVRRIEYDIVAVNTDYVVVVSVKMRLTAEDVKFFVEERLPVFKDCFPRYHDTKVIGAVAGASIMQEVDRYAIRQGLYVLCQSGDNIEMVNEPDFQPKVF